MNLNPGGPILEYNEALVEALVKIFTTTPASDRPQLIIETGTYFGTGTTKHVIDAIEQINDPKVVYKPDFYTIEVNEKNYKVAKEFGEDYPLVTFVHGSSVSLSDAKFFVMHDEYLMNPENHPDVFYDSDKPVDFYLAEVEGMLDFYGTGEFGEDNVLDSLLKRSRAKDKRPLFLLDSAGGIGYLEFRYVVEEMAHRRYYLFVKGINHVKHCRSYQQIIADEEAWRVELQEDDWVLATHLAQMKKR